MDYSQRALVILAAYDYESLAITLQSLEHTVAAAEKVVVVLNGKRFSLPAEKVERVARNWAAKAPDTRFVVRPLCSGSVPYYALTEVLKAYEPLKNVNYICKIDDDLIPVKQHWLSQLATAYTTLSQKRKVGFVTGLINNNSWGFEELVQLYDKQNDYRHQFNYTSVAGRDNNRKVAPGKIDNGEEGTIWSYPYLAWWVHQWTSLEPRRFIEKTAGQSPKSIPLELHYSIGCVFFEKVFWLSMDVEKYKTSFDERLLHEHCKAELAAKWAVMDEPMVHLFYRTQRAANANIIPPFLKALAAHFNDDRFLAIEPLSPQDATVLLDDTVKEMQTKLNYVHKKFSALSFMKNWREKRKKRQLDQ